MSAAPPHPLVERITGIPVRYPKRTLALLLIASCAMGTGMLKLEFDPSSERVFPKGHWAVESFTEFREAFGGDEAIFLGVESKQGDVFHPETLQVLRTLTRSAAGVDGVEEAFALPDVPVLQFQPLVGPRLAPGLPADLASVPPEGLARWKQQVLATPFVDKNLVSADRKSTLAVIVLGRLDTGVEGAKQNRAVCEAIDAAVRQQRAAGWTIHMAGTPMIKARIMGSIEQDLYTFAIPLLFIALVTSTLVLRSLRATFLVLAVLIVCVDLTLGTMGHLGVAIDPMNTMVPVLILVIGVADCLHLLVEQRAQAARLGPKATGAETITAALGHVCKPCFLTSFTTAIGFGSLVTSDIKPIAEFGVSAALASLVAFLVSMILIPAAASLLAPPKPSAVKAVRADRLGALVVRWPKRSLAAGLVFTVGISLGWTQLYADTNFLEFFRKDDPLVVDAREIQERFGGVAPCELVVKGPAGLSRRPEVLKAMLALERDLEEMDIVDRALSAADIVKAAVGVMHNNAGEIPDTTEGLDDLNRLLTDIAGGQLPMDDWISPPGELHPEAEWMRINVRAQAVGSVRYGDLVARVEELEAKHFKALGVEVSATGTSVVFSQTADRIMTGQVNSFFWAFLSITIVMIVALRSVRLGLLSIVPNFVPIAALIGSMGYLGIPLNSFNSMVASIAIGIAVDDTIHILTGFKRFSAELPLKAAVQETVAHEGAAILATSTVLFAGFCVLLVASFVPTANFGLLTAIAIGAALVGDLILLPGLLLLLPWLHGRGLPAPVPKPEPEPKPEQKPEPDPEPVTGEAPEPGPAPSSGEAPPLPPAAEERADESA